MATQEMGTELLANPSGKKGGSGDRQRGYSGVPQTVSWDWFGGFFDGEGHISIRVKDHRSVGLYIGQVDKRPLTAIASFLATRGISTGMYHRPAKGNHRPAWMLHIRSKYFVEYTLNHLLPFLIVKHEQAHKALTFLIGLRAGGLRRTLNPDELASIREKYLGGMTNDALQSEYHVGWKAIRSALPKDDLRSRRRLPNSCPICGKEKRWRKSGRDGQIAICRQCENRRRQELAQSRKAYCINCGQVLSQRKVGKCRQCWLAGTQRRRNLEGLDERLRFEQVLGFRKEELCV